MIVKLSQNDNFKVNFMILFDFGPAQLTSEIRVVNSEAKYSMPDLLKINLI